MAKKTKKTKKTFTLFLEKMYSGNGLDVTVEGELDIEAKDVEEAKEIFDKMCLEDCLQSTDPRIRWDWDDCALTEEEVRDKDLDYVDWSFGLMEIDRPIREKEAE